MSFRRQPRRVRTLGTLLLPGFPANRQGRRQSGRGDPYARRHAESELRGEFRCHVSDLEDLAVEFHAKPVPPLPYPFVPSGLFAEFCGFEVRQVQGCTCGTSCGKVLRVRPSADVQRFNLRVLHELAHAILRERCPDHTHADVWALTLMLAIPRFALRIADIAHHVPAWVVPVRARLARKVGRAA